MLSLESVSHGFLTFLQLLLPCLRTGAHKKAFKDFSKGRNKPKSKKPFVRWPAAELCLCKAQAASVSHCCWLPHHGEPMDVLRNAWENLEQTWTRGVRALGVLGSSG